MADLATVTRAAPRGMITLRGDLAASKLKKVVKKIVGQTVPQSGQFLGEQTRGVAWMSPDELLIVVPYDEAADAIEQINKALTGHHFLAADVSDARAVFTIEGPDAREVLARLCPVDLHRDSFRAVDFRRSRLAQIAAAFWMHETGFDLICFRSVADYADGVLKNATGATKTGAL